MQAIEVKNVQKHFGKLEVLKDINLTVNKGEVFTLLGENGAGKTTLINILATLSSQDNGSVSILGLDPKKQGNKIRKLISLNAQEATLDGEFTGYENLKLVATLRGLHDVKGEINKVADRLELHDFLKRKVMTYSGGMRRRLDLAMSLLGNPEIIFLDEPTTGVDPKNRLALWEMIKEMRAEGKTVFLTTQMLEEADKLSDHIAFISHGEIVRYGTPNEIKQMAQEKYLFDVNEADLSATKALLETADVDYQQTKAGIEISATTSEQVLELLVKNEIKLLHFNLAELDLETVFLDIIKK